MKCISKERPNDERVAREVGEFLDNTLYKESFITDFVRNEKKETQVVGVDVEFNMNGKHYLSDEKSTAQWRNISTFTLELSTINKEGEVIDGWLVNDNEINNLFALVWLNDYSVDVVLVEREKIMNHLNSIGWTKEKLKRKAKQIRYEGDTNMGNLYVNGCKFFYSTQLVEKPINVQLKKKTYKELALLYKSYPTEQFKR